MSDTSEAQDQTQDQDQNQDQQQQADNAQADSHETEARKMGWRPEEEWDDSGGGTWLDAKTFTERNEYLKDRGDKILKAEIAKQSAEIAKQNRQIGTLGQTIKDLGTHLTKADQRAYQKALKELESKADKAVEEGDPDAYRRAKGEMKDLEQEVKAEAKQETKPAPVNDPAYDTWLPDNSWYDQNDDGFDPKMAAFADSIVKQVARTGLTGEAYFKRITAEVKKEFPDRFGNQRRRQAPAVEGARPGGGGNGKTAWSKVPKEVQQGAFKRFVEQGLYEDTKEGREEYAEIYISE
jgi:hypothetical protein